MFFSNGRKALKLRKYTILVFAVVVVVFLALLAIYIEPPQPNVDIQANTKFDIERYLSEDIPKTDTILEIKLKSEKYYPDLTLKLDTQYLNFSYEEYVNYTYNSSNTISKPAGFIPPNGVPVGGGPPVIGAFVTPYDSSLEEEIDGGGTMHGGGPSVGGGGAPGGLTKTPYHGCIDSINDKYLIYNTSNYTGFIYDGLNNTFYQKDMTKAKAISIWDDKHRNNPKTKLSEHSLQTRVHNTKNKNNETLNETIMTNIQAPFQEKTRKKLILMMRPPGFEPGLEAWKASVLDQSRPRPHLSLG